ncbi:MAG: DUF1570 domain-containing protein [Phycisphaerales bacterium]|nr:DUF1570 domain-containing protein [Phycisphaerales bacterium]
MKLLLSLGTTLLLVLATFAIAQNPSARSPMRDFDTPYYKLSTNVDVATAREADLRMTRMFEEYRRRLSDFSVAPRLKLPFYLFADEPEYYAAGGMPGSAGVFIRSSRGAMLMALARPGREASTWHTVQHEGFHQFAAMTINMRLPVWLNEGLAEYFGSGIFTGDNFIVGVIPPRRLEEVQEQIKKRKWKNFTAMTNMSHEAWNNQMDMDNSNYDQAWAMVHFLIHGEDGKYSPALVKYMMAMHKGATPQNAWTSTFGNPNDIALFQEKCQKWWADLPENPTRETYFKALVSTTTSMLARHELQRRKIETIEELFAAPALTDVKLSRDLWLPAKLIDDIERPAKRFEWKLERPRGKNPQLTCTVPQIGTITGTFTLAGNRVGSVSVTVTKESE